MASVQEDPGLQGSLYLEDITIHTGQVTPMERGHRWWCTLVKISSQEPEWPGLLSVWTQLWPWGISHYGSLGPDSIAFLLFTQRAPWGKHAGYTVFLPKLQLSLLIEQIFPGTDSTPPQCTLFTLPASQTRMVLGTHLPPYSQRWKKKHMDLWSLKDKGTLNGIEDH